MFYLAGITDHGTSGPRRVDVREWYDSEQEARDRLGVVMSLSSLAFGDALTASASWYLQHAAPRPRSALERTDYFYGYLLDELTWYPIAGGFASEREADGWEPFIEVLERERASAAGLPYLRDELLRFRIDEVATEGRVNFSHFRFAPVSCELLVRPMNVQSGELLF